MIDLVVVLLVPETGDFLGEGIRSPAPSYWCLGRRHNYFVYPSCPRVASLALSAILSGASTVA